MCTQLTSFSPADAEDAGVMEALPVCEYGASYKTTACEDMADDSGCKWIPPPPEPMIKTFLSFLSGFGMLCFCCIGQWGCGKLRDRQRKKRRAAINEKKQVRKQSLLKTAG